MIVLDRCQSLRLDDSLRAPWAHSADGCRRHRRAAIRRFVVALRSTLRYGHWSKKISYPWRHCWQCTLSGCVRALTAVELAHAHAACALCLAVGSCVGGFVVADDITYAYIAGRRHCSASGRFFVHRREVRRRRQGADHAKRDWRRRLPCVVGRMRSFSAIDELAHAHATPVAAAAAPDEQNCGDKRWEAKAQAECQAEDEGKGQRAAFARPAAALRRSVRNWLRNSRHVCLHARAIRQD